MNKYFTLTFILTIIQDVMLLKLNEPVNSKDIPFVELNRNPDLPRLDETVTVMGLGALYEGGDYPDLLQSVEVDMIDNEFCTAAYEDIGLFPIPDGKLRETIVVIQ